MLNRKCCRKTGRTWKNTNIEGRICKAPNKNNDKVVGKKKKFGRKIYKSISKSFLSESKRTKNKEVTRNICKK